jgi:hypothetical protein
MSPWKRRAKRDRNESELVKAIRHCGGQWLPLNVKDGPDGVIGHAGRTLLAEVKTPTGKLKEGQAEFHKGWRGGTIHVLRTVDDVLALLRGCE